MALLEVKNLHLNLGGKNILSDVNLEVWEGHIHAIVGPNGAGKSTLAYSIMGLGGYRNISGDILFAGERINELNIYERSKRGITLGWQEPARFEGIPIKTFLAVSAKDKSRKNIRNALERVALDPDSYLNRAVDKTLSGGERKKIELASIMLMQPKLLLLDEPDSGIDVEALERIFDIIRVVKEQGSTVVMITHSMEVLQKAEHAFLLCSGHFIDKGSVEKISAYFKNTCLPCDHKNIPQVEEQNL